VRSFKVWGLLGIRIHPFPYTALQVKPRLSHGVP
jgi:hypothetical protein